MKGNHPTDGEGGKETLCISRQETAQVVMIVQCLMMASAVPPYMAERKG